MMMMMVIDGGGADDYDANNDKSHHMLWSSLGEMYTNYCDSSAEMNRSPLMNVVTLPVFLGESGRSPTYQAQGNSSGSFHCRPISRNEKVLKKNTHSFKRIVLPVSI
jgi:hypothetical protein